MTSSCAIWDFRRQIDGAKSTSRFGSRDGASEWPCQVWTPASSRLTCNCLLTATIRAKDLARRGRLARAPSAVLPVLKCGVHLGCFSRIAALQHQRDLVDEPSASYRPGGSMQESAVLRCAILSVGSTGGSGQ